MRVIGQTWGDKMLGQEGMTNVLECEKCGSRQTIITEEDKTICRQCKKLENSDELDKLQGQYDYEDEKEAFRKEQEEEENWARSR